MMSLLVDISTIIARKFDCRPFECEGIIQDFNFNGFVKIVAINKDLNQADIYIRKDSIDILSISNTRQIDLFPTEDKS